jgi:hypothetical protein
MASHVANMRGLLAGLDETEQTQLFDLLGKLLAGLPPAGR